MMKNHIRWKKNVNYSNSHNHNVLYLLTIFKYLQLVNQKRSVNIKNSSVLNLQIKIVWSEELSENSPCIMWTQHLIFWKILLRKRENILLLNHHVYVSNKNEVLPILCSFFFFLEDDVLQKLAVALKFLYFFTVLSLNSICFINVFY